MKNNNTYFAALLAALLALPLSAQAGVAIIVHPSTPVDAITADQASQIYMGRTNQLPDGTAVKQLDQAEGTPARAQFLAKVLNKTEAQLRSYWSRMIFTGKAQPPRVLGNTAEVLRTVASTPGYIGYVDSKDATSSKIKVLYTAP